MSKGQCEVAGCSTPVHSKGYCNKHYLQIWKHKKLTPELERMKVNDCIIPNCEGKVRSKGYCSKHYYRFVLKEREKSKETDKTIQ
ncbi:hypothetical protein [Bacillus toyonensis]|uniref:hypothetical protein n=1 Tax=Bacillus toyonensis TaxID=155322 RepID=UPI000BF47A83|nr:hypothetical protein [Bacillus toyonensis]PGF05240.1 hypothetical protein COM61_02160 [Bacillus toyonensis]